MNDKDSKKIIIEGITEDGHPFRPSDWAERIAGNLATFRNHRVFYSHLLKPIVINEIKCMALEKTLQQSHPALYEYILEFARKNRLKICGENGNKINNNKNKDEK